MRYFIASCAIFGLALAIGCSTTTNVDNPSPWTIDNIHTLSIDPATKGAMHNQFLDIMFSHKDDPEPVFVLEDFIAAYEELFQEYDLTAPVIAEVIDQFTPAFNGLVDTWAITYPGASIVDPSATTDYLIEIGAFIEGERDDLLGFLTDLANAEVEKDNDVLVEIAEDWIDAQANDRITSAASIMFSSAHYWVDKHHKPTNAEIIQADTIGGLAGYLFGGVGSIIGAGISSYMAAIQNENVGDH